MKLFSICWKSVFVLFLCIYLHTYKYEGTLCARNKGRRPLISLRATCHVPRSCGGKRVSSLCLRQIILSLRPYWLHHKYMQMLIFNRIILMYIVSNLQLSFTLTFVLCVFLFFFRFLKFEWQVMTIRAVLLPASVIGHSSRIPVLRDVRNNHLGV